MSGRSGAPPAPTKYAAQAPAQIVVQPIPSLPRPPSPGVSSYPETKAFIPQFTPGNVANTFAPEFEVKNYQGIIANPAIETELLEYGYAPINKIVVRDGTGTNVTQYIKAINKKGQRVFILVDVSGFMTPRSADVINMKPRSASVVPYSIKTGAYTCAGKDVCGVAFECGSDSVCVLARGANDLNPVEANFSFTEVKDKTAGTLEVNDTIMSYPVIRMSEIRVNPALVLSNTDLVTRRLRNATYSSDLADLVATEKSIAELSAAFASFNEVRKVAADKLNATLAQLDKWNDTYMNSPPLSEEAKNRYRLLQYNLAQRNEGIATLLRSMHKVGSMYAQLETMKQEIIVITDHCRREFANLDYAVSE
jgi:hypothetical protein